MFTNVFWGWKDNKKKYHWESWKELYFPTVESGVGIRHLADTCNALQLKQWWKFKSNNTLWGKFLLAKYCKRVNVVAKKGASRHSMVWKTMMKNKKEVEQHIF